MDLSVILPTYNEAENIKILIPILEKFFSEKYKKFEIIIVDDNSPDKTAETAEKLNEEYGNIRAIVRKKKEGIGAALRAGYDEARGNLIFSLDADLAFELKDIEKLFRKFDKGFDLVTGSKYNPKSSYEKPSVHMMLKSIISFSGNKLCSIMLGVPLTDFSLNFRIIKKKAWKSIRTTKKNNDFLLEMIFLAWQKKYKIAEIPVSFKKRIHGQSKTFLPAQTAYFITSLLEFWVLKVWKKDH